MPDLKRLTKQEAFDAVWHHFIEEKQPFGWDDKTQGCVFVSDEGACCAVGLFMDPILAREEDQNDSTTTYDIDWKKHGIVMHHTVRKFLHVLQGSHDFAADIMCGDPEFYGEALDHFREDLLGIANEFNIKLKGRDEKPKIHPNPVNNYRWGRK